MSMGRLYVHGYEQRAICSPNSYKQTDRKENEKKKDKFQLGMIAVKRKGRENRRQDSCKIVTCVFSLQLLVCIFLPTVYFILVC